MKKKAIILTCSASKLKGQHKAKDLYSGGLFKVGRKLADDSGLPWFILSAEYGVLHPDELISDYENRISNSDKRPLIEKVKSFGQRYEEVHCVGASSYAPLCYGIADSVISASGYFVGNPGTTRLYVEYRDNSLRDVEDKHSEYLQARRELALKSSGQVAKGVTCRATGKITGALWDIFDATLNNCSLLPKWFAYSKGIEDATIRIQYMKYHRFYDLPLCGLK